TYPLSFRRRRLEDGISITGYDEMVLPFHRARLPARAMCVWKTLRANLAVVSSPERAAQLSRHTAVRIHVASKPIPCQ
ncbi:MAG: hypothetical protein J5875_11310, partial [Paludibacteraceae bacterium]|nr:hypothetical protein [Paludibacteraceae bacterium]